MRIAHALTIVSLLLVSTTAIPSSSASITYDVVSYPAHQDGYQLSGTITTDGTIGALSASDFMSWSLTISNATESYTISSLGQPTATVLVGDIEATATSIYLPAQNIPVNMNNVLILHDAAGGKIMWSTQNFLIGPDNAPLAYNGYFYASHARFGADLWENIFTVNTVGFTIATTGTVPEPSSLVMLGLGAFGLIGVALKQRLSA